MYKIIITKIINPNQALKSAVKYEMAIIISAIVGKISKIRYSKSPLIESVPLSITRKTSPVFLYELWFFELIWFNFTEKICKWMANSYKPGQMPSQTQTMEMFK